MQMGVGNGEDEMIIHIAGYAIIAGMFGLIFCLMARDIGWKETFILWGLVCGGLFLSILAWTLIHR